MKKILTLCFFILFSFSFCKAQFVTIPDTAFVNWLNNNGFATAMNASQMDTTNSLVQNADTLNIGAPGMSNIITNLYGIQFFPSVQVLICDGNFMLDQIPAFPRNLTYLEVQNSPFLNSLPAIPSGVTSVTINNNNLSSIISFPASARYIYCSGNKLTSLPALSGNSLIELDCSSNLLTSLPALPSSLSFLECGSNNLTTLPALPGNLTQLDCESMPGLTCFPYLPNSLEFMNYTGTGITCIPNIPVNTNSGNDYEPALTSLPLCSCTSGCGAYAGISITASQTTVCNGGKVTFTATTTNGGTNPQYQWVVNGVNTGSSSAVFKDSTLTDGSTVSCVLTGNSTCADSTSAKSNTLVITIINQLPNLVVSPRTICSGNSGTLTASGATTYTWLPATGLSITTGASITANPTITTTYTVSGTNSCGTTMATAVVTVNSLPVVTVNSVELCATNPGTLTASGASTYTWSPAARLNSSTGASVIFTAITNGKTNITVTGTNSCGTATAIAVVTVISSVPTASLTPSSLTLCKGASAKVTASGGDTYTWSPSAGLSATTGATVTVSTTVTTSYLVTATNVCGSGRARAIGVTVSASLVPTVTVNSPIICNGSGGTLTASGTSNTYSWLPSSGLSVSTGSSVTASPTVTTTYTVTGVITSTGCSATQTSIVTVNPQPNVSVNALTVCSGNSGTLSASGADTYSWSPSTGLSATTGASVTANPTITTTYTVSGTNSCGTTTATSVVTVNPLPAVSVNNLTICSGLSDTLKASGADTYVWLPSTGLSNTTGASVIANPTVTTTYTVSGTNSCGTTTAVAMVKLDTLNTLTVSPSIAICLSNTTTLTVSGAATYTWAPATGLSVTTGSSITTQPSATTTYTVTGTNSCGATTATTVVTVNTGLPVSSISPASLVLCNGKSGTLIATSTGGGPYTYAWSPSTGLSATTGATVTTSPTITTGYSLIVSNACGSKAAKKASVTVNPVPAVTVNSPAICSGLSGTLTASGTSNTYSWSPSGGLGVSTGSSVTASPTITSTYTVTGVITSTGCSASNTSVVTVNPQPNVSVNNLIICSGLSDTLKASGATTYIWLPSTGLSNTTGASVIANPTVTTTYTVTGISSAGCSATNISVVTVNPQPAVTVNNLTFCNGLSDTLKAGGADTYSWSPSTGLSSTTDASVIANPTITTTYTVSGTNSCGTSTATSIVTVNPLPATAVSNIAICNGTSGTLTASGADTYTWLPSTGLSATTGALVTANPTVTTTYTVTGTNSCGTTTAKAVVKVDVFPVLSVNSISICSGSSGTLIASGASTYTWAPIKALSATTGSSVITRAIATTTYTVTGTNSCGATTATAVVTVDNSFPTISVSPTSLTLCSGKSGTLTATATGGTPYTYVWSPASGLDNISGKIVTASPTISTTYSLKVLNGCGAGRTLNVPVKVNPLPVVSVDSVTICSGLSGTLTAGGTAAAYSWLPTGTLNSSTGTSVTANPTITTTYTVTGFTGSCSSTATSVVTVNLQPATAVNNLTICSGLSDTLNASGADTYTWSPSSGLSSTTGASVIANPTITTTYTVSGTNSCGTTTATSVVTVNPLPVVSVNNLTICSGMGDTLKASGADAYTWSPASGLSDTTGAIIIANPIATTTYTVSGTNSCGTTTAISVVTVNPQPLISVNNLSFCSGLSGTLTAGGIADSYSWLPSVGLSATTGASVLANPTVTTSYTVSGTNSCGTTTAVGVVTVNPLPATSVSSIAICSGNSGTLTASGATTYTWSPSTGLSATTGASITASPAATTTYTLTGTNGCGSTTANATVTVIGTPTVVISPPGPKYCTGGSATITASNSAGGATTYTWSPSTGLNVTTGATVTASPTITSVYTITAINSCGTGTKLVRVTVNPSPVITVNSPAICGGLSTSLTATNTGGPSTFKWSPTNGLSASIGSSITANPTVTTTYTVTSTISASGCSATNTSVVTVNPQPAITVNNLTICSGLSDTLKASGATTYTWLPSTGLSNTTGANVIANPTITTTYTVTGTNTTTGCIASNISVVAVNPLPATAVNSLIICSGLSDTLKASGATAYVWSPSTGLSNSTGASVVANPTVSTTYTVTGVSIAGCSATNISVVTVNPQPATAVNNLTICSGLSDTLKASGADSYTWSPSNGLSNTTGASVVANPTITTTYTVTGTNSCGSITAISVVTVNPQPATSVNNLTICSGLSDTLKANGADIYTWLPSTGLSNAMGANVIANPLTTTTYTVSGTNSCGTSTAIAVVRVNPLPAVSVNNLTICSGLSDTLKASGADNYTWLPSSGLSNTTGVSVIANPLTTTTYTVSGTNSCGTSTAISVVTVNPLPATSVNSLTICSGLSDTLKASGADTYAWLPSSGLSNTTGASVIANPLTTTTYIVSGTNSCGTSTAIAVVTVNSLPNVSVNNLTICSGLSDTLKASGADTYAWLPSTGLSNTTGGSVIANPLITTTYNVSGTNSCGTSTAIAVVTVNPLPAVSVNNLTLCEGVGGTLTANGAATYAWLPSTGLSSTTGASVIANPLTTTTYTVSGTNSCGTTSATAVVTVNPQPKVSVNNQTICSGSRGTLTASGATTYAWLPSTGLNATTGASVSANPTIITTYTVSGTNSCGTTTATAVVTVNPLPVVSVNNLTLCEGVGGTLTANGADSYTWLPSKGLSASTGASVTANPTVTTTYTVSGTNSCGTTANTAVVTVTPVYTSSFTVPSSPVCGVGKAVAINYTGNAPRGATYNWDFDGGIGFIAGSDTQSISWDTAGTYTVSLMVANGSCSSTLTTQNVVIKEMPSSAFTATSPVCDGHASIITCTGSSVVPNAIYNWNFGVATGGVVGATNQALTFPGAGTYTISLIASADGCTSTLVSQAIVINGLPSVYVNDLTICSGERKAIAASGADTYSWAPSTGLTPTTGFSVTASPAETTTYTITGTSKCGTTTATAVVTVNPQPYISVNSLTFCSGQIGTLTASGSANYTWAPSAGLSATTGASVTANPTTTTTYSIVGINSCNATLATTVVTVNKTPAVVATAGSAAGLEQLTANWNAAKGVNGYMLDVSLQSNFSSYVTGYNNLSVGNVTTYIVTGLTPSTAYYYRVRANDTTCGIGANSNTIVYSTLLCTAITGGTVIPASTVICPGTTQVLALNGLPGLNQQWQISTDNISWNNVNSGGNSTTYTTQSSDGNSKKYYRCISFNGCFNAASTTTIVDVSQPLITITASNITDNSFTLNWTPAGAGNYEVDYAGASSGTLTSVTPPLTLTGLSSGGAYSVTVTQTTPAGCAAFGIVSGVNTLCTPPTSMRIAGTANNSINLAWNGPVGNYRVYYMLMFTSQHTILTKDVTNATSVTIGSLLSGATYQFYVASLNCGSTPGQVSGFVTGTTTTTVAATCTAAAPVIDSVRTTCSSELQIWVHGSTTNLYKIYVQQVAPIVQAVYTYTISGGNFSINKISGQSFIIGAASVCSNGAVGSYAFWPQTFTVPATCDALDNLLISQPFCTGFTASWNADNCDFNKLSSYLLSVRKQGAISWTSYAVLPTANFKVMSGLLPGTNYQCFVRSAYSCTGYLVYGPASATQTVTTASSGCRVEDEQTIPEEKLTPVTLAGNSEESFSLYPNPNTGEFMVDFSRLNTDEEQVRIEVINVLGQTVLTHVTSISSGHMSEFINLPNCTVAGTYIVRLTAGRNVYTARINISK